MARQPQLRIITDALTRLIPGSRPADVTIRVTDRGAGGGIIHSWEGTVPGLAEKISAALLGRPAPAAANTAEVNAGIADSVTAETKRLLERRTRTLRERAEHAEAAITRAREHCQAVRDRVGPSGMINASQVLGLLSPTWPDGNYEAASEPYERHQREHGQ